MPSKTPHIDTAFLMQVLDSLDALVFVKDSDRRFVYTNAQFLKAAGKADVTGLLSEDYETPDRAAVFRRKDEKVLKTGKPLVWEGATPTDGWEVIKRLPFDMADGSRGILSVIFDITEFHNMQIEVEALRRTEILALHDPLTGLPNRRHLEKWFDDLDGEKADQMVLFHLDLDEFKPINDDYGHAAGDAILIEVARRMKAALGSDGFAARIGGDEFVGLTRLKSQSDAEAWANGLLDSIGRPIEHRAMRLRIGASCGIVMGGLVEPELDAMLHAADIALYQAKQNGRNQLAAYTEALGARLEEEKRQKEQIHRGLERREFVPLYQPQIDLQTGSVVGLEALARWRHPVRGLVPPFEFIPVFEALGWLDDLDLMILDAVLADARALAKAGLAPRRISVNMSATLLARTDLLELFRSRAPFDFKLVIELSEAVSFESLDADTRFRIDGLRELGCEIEVDDFGSAQASVLGVISIQPDRLKIDKGLILPLLDAPQSARVVKAILQIAQALEIPVIAEGVETEAHAQILARLGCQYGQGYHFAHALAMDELMEFLRRHPQAPSSGKQRTK